MYLKSQCALNHGNQVQSQPHGSEPLSPQNEKRKKERKSKSPVKKRKREKPCIPERNNPRVPRTPPETPQPESNRIKTEQKTKKPRSSEPKNQKHPRPDHQPSPDALCTDHNKNPPTPIYEKSKNQRISHYSLLVRSPPVSSCSELVAHRPSGSHSD